VSSSIDIEVQFLVFSLQTNQNMKRKAARFLQMILATTESKARFHRVFWKVIGKKGGFFGAF